MSSQMPPESQAEAPEPDGEDAVPDSAEKTSSHEPAEKPAEKPAQEQAQAQEPAEKPSQKSPREQTPSPDPSPEPSQRRSRLAVLCALVVVCALTALSFVLLFGGKDGDEAGKDTAPASQVNSGSPPSVGKLASAMHCKAKITTKVDDYRQGACGRGDKRVVFLTFSSNKAKRDWLDISKDYGGAYLTGNRWLIVGNSPSQMTPVLAEYGGSLEQGTDHHSHH